MNLNFQKEASPNEYLLQLEKYQYIPNKNYVDDSQHKNLISSQNRIKLLEWMFSTNELYQEPLNIFNYSITLFDTYISLTSHYHQLNEFQLVLCVCYSISNKLLKYNHDDISTYVNLYMSGKYTDEQFYTTRNKIITEFGGHLIRSSPTFFFNTQITQKLCAFVCFEPGLMIYEPSVIAKTISYMLGSMNLLVSKDFTKASKIVCELIIGIIKKMLAPDVNKGIAKLAKEILAFIKKKCPQEILEKISLIKEVGVYSTKKFTACELTNLKKKWETIGSGISGDVFKIERDKDVYAVKHNEDEEFVNEISCLKVLVSSRCINNIGSTNIVKLEGFQVLRDDAFLVFEHGNFNLREAIEKNKIDTNFVSLMKYFKGMLEGLSLIHYYDILHGDLKPDNIVFFNGVPKIIDFGNSIPFFSVVKKNDKLPREYCSLYYRAPEIISSIPINYDYKSDVWSLGAIFYFMISGKQFIPRILSTFKYDPANLYLHLASTFDKVFNFKEQQEIMKNDLNEKYNYEPFIKIFLTVNPLKRPSAQEALDCLNISM